MASPLANLVALLKPKRRWALFCFGSLLLAAIAGARFGWWLYEPYRLASKLRNGDVTWDDGYFGLNARVTGDPAVSLLHHGRCSTPALLDALNQPDRFAAAHVLLTGFWQYDLLNNTDEWNH